MLFEVITIMFLLTVTHKTFVGAESANCSGSPVTGLTLTQWAHKLTWELSCGDEVPGNTTWWYSSSCPQGAFVSGLEWINLTFVGVACTYPSSHVIRNPTYTCYTETVGMSLNETLNVHPRYVIINIQNSELISLVHTSCHLEHIRCVVPRVANGVVGVHQALPEYGPLATAYAPVGGRFSVACNRGYFPRRQLSTATCKGNGNWTKLPKCKTCRAIPNCRVSMCTRRRNTVCVQCFESGLFVLDSTRTSCNRPPNVTAKYSPEGVVTCTSHGTPPLNLTLYDISVGNILNFNTSFESPATLVTMVTSGVGWVCEAANEVNKDSQQVMAPGSDVSSLLPSFPLFLSGHLQYAGEQLTIDCETVGNPKPTVTWYKFVLNQGYKQLALTDGRVRTLRNGTLLFRPIVETDYGAYRCVYQNSNGQGHYDVFVREPII